MAKKGVELPRMPDLRGYQQDIVDRLRASIASGKRRPLVSLPTGAGKTRLALAVAAAAAAKGNPTGVMVERNVLADQWALEARRWGFDTGIVQAGRTWRGRHLTVYSQQTVEKRSGSARDTWPDEPVVFVDEAHIQRDRVSEWVRAGAGRSGAAEQSAGRPDGPAGIVIGLTATPMAKGLADTWDDLIAGPTTQRLTEEGHLVPLQVFMGRAKVDMRGAKVNRATGEWTGQAVDDRMSAIVGSVADEWMRVAEERFDSPPKTLCFSATVASGAKLVKAFNGLGCGEIAAQISYADKPRDRADILRRYGLAEGEPGKLYVLVNVSVVGRGFDVPDAGVLIDASPYRASIQSYAQMIGRVLRPANGAAVGGESAMVFDHTGNYARFLPQWRQFFKDGVRELLAADDEDEEEKRRRVVLWQCPGVVEYEQEVCGGVEMRQEDCREWLPDAEATCRRCGFDRETADGGGPDRSLLTCSGWLCSKCETGNPDEFNACRKCGKEAKKPSKTSDTVQGWQCGCGAINALTSFECADCGEEKPERYEVVAGTLEPFVEEEPVGVDVTIDAREDRKYSWAHLCELALRHYLNKQRTQTPALEQKALTFAQARFMALFGIWPGWPLHTAREPEVDPRIEGWWLQKQAEYGSQFRRPHRPIHAVIDGGQYAREAR